MREKEDCGIAAGLNVTKSPENIARGLHPMMFTATARPMAL